MLIFNGETLVGGIEAVDLANVVLHHGAHGSEFFLQLGNTACIGGFGLTQFLEQVLYALLLAAEEVLEAVIADIHILIAIELNGEVFVFFLQFLFLDRHLLHQFVQLRMLRPIEIRQRAERYYQHDEDDPEERVVILFLVCHKSGITFSN